MSTDELYFGYTNNLKRRFQEHNKKQVFATKKKFRNRWFVMKHFDHNKMQQAESRSLKDLAVRIVS